MRANVVCLLAFLSGAASIAAAAEITYTLPRDGRVSLAIYDTEGRQVRTLRNADPQAKGPHAISWDGLDSDGKPVAVGEYTWKLLQTQGLQAEYLLSIGTDFGPQHWPAQHGGPGAVATDGKALWMFSDSSEISPSGVKVSLDGKIDWLVPNLEGWHCTSDIALDGDTLHVLAVNSGTIHRLDPATGKGKKDLGRFSALLPVLKLDFKSGQNAPAEGWQAARLEPYRRDRGWGWEKIDGITAEEGGGKNRMQSDCHRFQTKPDEGRDFLVDLPDGQYAIRFHLGSEKRASGNFMGFWQKEDKQFQWVTDMRTGTKAGEHREFGLDNGYGQTPLFTAHHGQLRLRLASTSTDQSPAALCGMEIFAAPLRFDIRGGQGIVVYPDWLGWFDFGALKANAPPKPLAQVKVPSVRDVAIAPDGSALALTADRIVAIAKGQSELVEKVKGLIDARRLALDPTTGEVLVAEWGTSHQVKRFDKSFRQIHAYGHTGGRKTGLYKAEDFHSISDIVHDGQGGFWITESQSAPRRTAHFDAHGKLLKEWYGGQQFYTWAEVDPGNSSRVWMDSQWNWLMEVEVDWAKRTWKPRACYDYTKNLDGKLVSSFTMTCGKHPFRRDLDGDGRAELYLWSDAHAGLIWKVDEAAGELKPVAILGVAEIGPYPCWKPAEVSAVWREACKAKGVKITDDNIGDLRLYRGFSWADANGDYKLQPEEMRLLPSDGHGFAGSTSGCQFLDQKLNIWQGRGYGGKDQPAWTIYPASEKTRTGAPVWDWSKSIAGLKTPYQSTPRVLPDEAGNVYTLIHGGDPNPQSGLNGDGYAIGGVGGWGGHGMGWPANQLALTAVTKYDAQGKRLWQVGHHAARENDLRGTLQYPVRFGGPVNGCIGVFDKIAHPCEFWTEDGLYVGGVFDRRAQDGLGDMVYTWWRVDHGKDGNFAANESLLQYDMVLGGSLNKLATGEVIFMGAGLNNAPSYKITGWDEFRRQEGKVQVQTPTPCAAERGHGLLAEYFGNADFKGEAALKRMDSRLWFDGSRKWPDHPVVKQPFSVRWTGMLEPRFSESYVFSVYAVGRAKVWLGGKLVLDRGRLHGDDRTEKSAAENGQWKEFSLPLQLQAGQKTPLRVEWEGPAGNGELHINWQSLSQPIEHIPTTCLYPETPATDLAIVRLVATSPRVLRSSTGEAPPAEFVLTRSGRTDQPLAVNLEWSGTEAVKRPTTVTIPAGKAEARFTVQATPSAKIAATIELVGSIGFNPAYLSDPERAEARVAIIDGRAKRLEVAKVTAKGKPAVDWAPVNLREAELKKLVDGSGLDRTQDPPTHDCKPENEWWAEWSDFDTTELVFDLGAQCQIADMLVWNANVTSSHEKGWGKADHVRHWSKKLRVAVAESTAGPWRDLRDFPLHRPAGKDGETPDRLPLGTQGASSNCVSPNTPHWKYRSQDCPKSNSMERNKHAG